MRYLVYLEAEPDLDAYRLHHAPRANLAPVFICPFLVVTGESGAIYNSMRGIQATEQGPGDEHGHLQAQRRPRCAVPDALPVVGRASRRALLDRRGLAMRSPTDPTIFGWTSACTTSTGGKTPTAPRRRARAAPRSGLHLLGAQQPGYDHPQMLRSHLGLPTGVIDGDPVTGLFMLDYIYSFPGAMWTEMGMLTKLHNLWLNLLVEYEDGGYEGG